MHDRVRLILQAALLDDQRGAAAWTAWQALAGAELLPEERQLAPTVFAALTRRGVTDPALRALEPYVRGAWLSYQANRAIATRALTQLHEAGIETLILKGAALIPQFYGDPKARRSGDVDILVAETRFFEAWACLAQAGWRPVGIEPRWFDTRFSHAAQLADGRGHSVDLHCHVLAMSCERGADDAFWGGSVAFDLDGIPARTLCATDHLLHVCVHGQIRGAVPAVRWYADAMIILRMAGSSADWTRFVALARERRVTLFAAAALDALVEIFELPLPVDVRRELRAFPVNAVDRMLFRAWTADSRGRPLLRVQWHLGRFLRGTSHLGALARLRALPRFLRLWLQKDSWIRMTGRLVRRAGRVLLIRAGVLPRDAATREYLEQLETGLGSVERHGEPARPRREHGEAPREETGARRE